MANISMVIPHRLKQDEALKRVKGLLNNTQKQFAKEITDLHEEWKGYTGIFSFSAMGFPISGTLTVGQSKVELSGKLPFLASLFKGKIESVIKQQADSILS